MNAPRQHHGFSLVETLVAMFIFVLSVGVLAESCRNAIFAISTMEIKEGSENNFQFIRDQVLTISDTDSLNIGGDVPTPTGGQGHWDAETETTETPDFFKITLKMTLAGDNDVKPESGSEVIYLLRPAWSQTQDRSALLSEIHDNLPSARTQQVWP